MENKSFENFLATLVTLLLTSLWFLPPFIIIKYNVSPFWSSLYIPVLVLSCLWGETIKHHYFK